MDLVVSIVGYVPLLSLGIPQRLLELGYLLLEGGNLLVELRVLLSAGLRV